MILVSDKRLVITEYSVTCKVVSDDRRTIVVQFEQSQSTLIEAPSKVSFIALNDELIYGEQKVQSKHKWVEMNYALRIFSKIMLTIVVFIDCHWSFEALITCRL